MQERFVGLVLTLIERKSRVPQLQCNWHQSLVVT